MGSILFSTIGTPQANRTNYNTSNATPERSRDQHSRLQHEHYTRDSPRQGAAAASRPTTLPLGTPPGSPGPPTRPGPPRDAFYHTPQKTKASSSPTKSYQPVHRHLPLDNPHADSGGNRPGLYHATSPSKPLHVHVDPGSTGRDDDNPPPLPDPPAHYSPLKLTQYDKDVAMFKGPEPPSQVSSSTDSGYGHTHIYERVPGDNFSRELIFCVKKIDGKYFT